MANLPSVFVKVNDQEMRQDTISAETQYSKFGSNDNYLRDALTTEISARGAGDTTNTTAYNNIKTEVNAELTNIPCLVQTVTYGPFYPSGTWPFPIPINLGQPTVSVFAHSFKFLSPNPDTGSRVRITIACGNPFVAAVPFQDTFLVSGLDRDDWEYSTTTINDNATITIRFYKIKTVTLV